MRCGLLALTLMLVTVGYSTPPQTSKKPLTKNQIAELVKAQVSSTHIADLVRENGIDFDPTEDFLRDLRNTGAEAVLIDALIAAKPAKPPVPDVPAKVVSPPAPDLSVQAQRHVSAANVLMNAGDIDGAIPLYQEAIQERPGDAETHFQLGVAFGRKKQWQQDIGEQRAAIQLNPDYADAKAELAVALRNSEPSPSEPSPAPAPSKVSTNGNDEQARKDFSEGQSETAQRKFEAAAISFSEAAQLMPDWPDPLVERGKVYMKLYLFQEAVHSYDAAIRLKANDPVTLNLRGYALYSASKFQESISDFDAAIRLDPGMAEAFKNRGNAKWQIGDKLGANADFAQAKALEASLPDARKTRRR